MSSLSTAKIYGLTRSEYISICWRAACVPAAALPQESQCPGMQQESPCQGTPHCHRLRSWGGGAPGNPSAVGCRECPLPRTPHRHRFSNLSSSPAYKKKKKKLEGSLCPCGGDAAGIPVPWDAAGIPLPGDASLPQTAFLGWRCPRKSQCPGMQGVSVAQDTPLPQIFECPPAPYRGPSGCNSIDDDVHGMQESRLCMPPTSVINCSPLGIFISLGSQYPLYPPSSHPPPIRQPIAQGVTFWNKRP